MGYVDDGAYSYASPDPTVLSRVLTAKYKKLEDWMNANKLVINPDKTHLMVMADKKNSVKRKNVTIQAGEHTIKATEKEKLLGGLLHQSLKWNTHIRDDKESLISQLTSRLNGLKRMSVNASFGTKLMVANGIVMSKLVYLITLWGGAQQYLINALQVQQLVVRQPDPCYSIQIFIKQIYELRPRPREQSCNNGKGQWNSLVGKSDYC